MNLSPGTAILTVKVCAAFISPYRAAPSGPHAPAGQR